MTMPVVVDPVVIPKKWTVVNAIAFAGAAAVSLIGVLTMVGVTVPSGVTTEVQTITGAATTIAGAVVGLLALLSKHSVVKAALSVGVPVETATRL